MMGEEGSRANEGRQLQHLVVIEMDWCFSWGLEVNICCCLWCNSTGCYITFMVHRNFKKFNRTRLSPKKLYILLFGYIITMVHGLRKKKSARSSKNSLRQKKSIPQNWGYSNRIHAQWSPTYLNTSEAHLRPGTPLLWSQYFQIPFHNRSAEIMISILLKHI